MINWIISSSLMIVGILIIRVLFQAKMSKKLQYALWGLVLLRLLIPFNIGHSILSIENFHGSSPVLPVESEETFEVIEEQPTERNPVVTPMEDRTPSAEPEPIQSQKSFMDSLSTVLLGIWILGGCAAGAMFICTNLTFGKRLKISRHKISLKRVKLPVYISNRIESPCLFGVFHPAIYLTHQVASDKTMFRHTLAHELCHYRHKDHIFAALRGLCLVIHWYNPLVWYAAILSQRDAEMACDEDTIRSLGESQRKEYGRTLIQATCQKSNHLLTAATTMTSDKKVLKQRLTAIVKKPRNVAAAVAAAILLAAVFVGCTFTGAKSDKITSETMKDAVSSDVWEAILFDNGTFYSTDFNQEMTVHSYLKAVNEQMDKQMEFAGCAYVDLDQDNNEEAILSIVHREEQMEYGLLILHQEQNQVTGFSQSIRQMQDIKRDGTFHWSGGAEYNGSATVVFTGNKLSKNKISWIENTEDGIVYYVNGVPADEQTYLEEEKAQEEKENAPWIPYNPKGEAEQAATIATVEVQEEIPIETTFTGEDEETSYHASVVLPNLETPKPVIHVTPHGLTAEDAERTAKALFPNAQFYEEESISDEILSREEIQKKLDLWRPYLQMENLEALYENTENLELNQEIVESFIADYEKKLQDAPEGNPHIPVQWIMKNEGIYINSKGADYSGTDYGSGIWARFTDHEIPYLFIASTKHGPDFSVDHLSCSIHPGMGPANLEEAYYRAKLCRTGKPSDSQVSEIKKNTQRLLEEFGLGKWIISDCHVVSSRVGDETEYFVSLTAVPALETYTPDPYQISGGINQNGTFGGQSITSSVFHFAPGGQLLSFVLDTPIEVHNLEEVSVLPSENLMDRMWAELAHKGARDYGFGSFMAILQEDVSCDVEVTELQYTHSRLFDSQNGYRYVPALQARGIVTYKGETTQKNLYQSSSPETLITINAIDGSIIP